MVADLACERCYRCWSTQKRGTFPGGSEAGDPVSSKVLHRRVFARFGRFVVSARNLS